MQGQPLVGQPIFLTQRFLLVGHLDQHLMFDQFFQTVSQQVAGQADTPLKGIEAPHT